MVNAERRTGVNRADSGRPGVAAAISQAYIDHQIGRKKAIEYLEALDTTQATLWAGELIVEQAQEATTTPLEVEILLDRASALFAKASRLDSVQPLDHLVARSRIHLAYMPVYRGLLLSGELPTPELAIGVYDDVLRVGRSAAEAHRSHSDQKVRKKLGGDIGQISSVAIFARLAISGDELGINRQTWFPQPALHTPMHAFVPGAALDPSYNMSIWTIADRGPDIAHKVLARSFAHREVKKAGEIISKPVPSTPDVVRLNVNPDLAIQPGEEGIGTRMIFNMSQELFGQHVPDVMVTDLNRRAQLGLTVLRASDASHEA